MKHGEKNSLIQTERSESVIKRKLIVASLSTFVSTTLGILLLNLVYEGAKASDFPFLVIKNCLWLFPIVLICGVPVSILSDYFTRRLSTKNRTVIALIIHLFFGIIFGLILLTNIDFPIGVVTLDLSMVASPLTAFCFWLIDELMKRKFPGLDNKPKSSQAKVQ